MASAQDDLVVVGGGMAGLMLAAVLDRRGVASTVLERTGSLDEIGAGVQLSPRSVNLLREVDLLDDVLERAVAVMSREIRSWRGELISRTELGETCEERYGAPYLAVHRADLQHALQAGVPAGTLHLGRPATGVSSSADRAAVDLEGGEVLDAAAVVGADGIRSTVRTALAPDRPVPSGLAAYRALVPSVLLPPEASEPVVRIWVGTDAHAVLYPLRGCELVNVVAVVPGTTGTEDWNGAASVEGLLAAYLGWDELLTGVLARVGSTSVWALHDRDPLTDLAAGRVALVGDAAHPMLPFAAQGVNQALEDAWVLGRCLAAPGSAGPVERLAAYSRLRAPDAAAAQASSRHLAAALHVPDGPGRDARDAALVAGAALSAQDALIAPRGWESPDP